ncbi:hypothetical protein ACFGOO_12035 [Treponema vincentii]|uniref:hypothetical protein n=1 Tax=Treponema vincentii TaxID=69710 RepID=UPI0035F54B74
MILLMYWGASIWGIEVFAWIVLGAVAIDIGTMLPLFAKEESIPGLKIGYVIRIVMLIILTVVLWFLGFPIKGTIITFLVVNTLQTIIPFFIGVRPSLLYILRTIGDIIGMVLFFKNVL